jgi:hypothetical protein
MTAAVCLPTDTGKQLVFSLVKDLQEQYQLSVSLHVKVMHQPLDLIVRILWIMISLVIRPDNSLTNLFSVGQILLVNHNGALSLKGFAHNLLTSPMGKRQAYRR